MAELGRTGLDVSGGQVANADFLREWRFPESFKRAREMALNSPVCAAMLASIEQSVRSVRWNLESEEGEEDPRIELWDTSVRMLDGGWGNFISEALGFLPYGFSLFELVWGKYENMTILSKLAPRRQDTVWQWMVDDNGKFKGFVQLASPYYRRVEIPAAKLLHLVSRSEANNPEGRSIFRTAWVPYYYCKNIQQVEAIGIERDLAGLPVIHLPLGADTSTASTSDASVAAKMVRNIRQDEQAGIVLPDGWLLELLSTGGSRQFDTDKIITRYEQRILMTSLAQFLMLGSNNVGSLALSRDQTDLFVMAVNTVADVIAAGFNTQVIPRLMALNGYDAEGLTLAHTPAGDVDLTAMATVIGQMTSAGFITPMPADEVYIRQMLKLPEVALEDLEEERERKAERADAISGAIQASKEDSEPQPERQEEQDEGEMEERGEEVDENRATEKLTAIMERAVEILEAVK